MFDGTNIRLKQSSFSSTKHIAKLKKGNDIFIPLSHTITGQT